MAGAYAVLFAIGMHRIDWPIVKRDDCNTNIIFGRDCVKITLRDLDPKDYKKAIQFAIEGMHFHWYMDSKWLLQLYGRYFWYLEMTRATQVIAAYSGDRFVGVLLAAMKGKAKCHHSFWKSAYVKMFDFLQNTFEKKGVGIYDRTNQEMFTAYCKDHNPDGEILFLAADPTQKERGIGSILLEELERRERGKQVYLYTDDACTYQFYERRGFHRAGERRILLQIGEKKTDLRCFLYSKTLGECSDGSLG